MSKNCLRMFLFILLLLSLAPLSLAQDEDYTRQALEIARDIIEEERGSPLQIARWRFLQEDWSTQANWQQYGSFGIDSCVADIIEAEKRDIIFGWTFTITDVYGKSWQVRVAFDLLTAVQCDEVITTAPASRPAASASVEISPGAANVSGFELGGQVLSLTDDTANLLKRAGMIWVKSQLPYTGSVEPGRTWVKNVKAKGFKILLSVTGGKAAHEPLANNFDSYTDNVAGVLRELARAGADAIEVWNEPNIEHEWPPGHISAAKYTELLKKAYTEIKSVSPGTLVISGAPAPTGGAGPAGCIPTVCNDDLFMRQMAEAGAARYMDCVGIHYNAGSVPPSATSGAPVGSSGHYTWYYPSMVSLYRNAFPSKPLCFTELGYLSGEGMPGPLPDRFAWAKDTTVAQQAAWIAEAAVLSAQSRQVRLMIVWNMDFIKWAGDPQRGYALLRPGGSCPGCDTLRTAMGG